jgi:hypothetical protein
LARLTSRVATRLTRVQREDWDGAWRIVIDVGNSLFFPCSWSYCGIWTLVCDLGTYTTHDLRDAGCAGWIYLCKFTHFTQEFRRPDAHNFAPSSFICDILQDVGRDKLTQRSWIMCLPCRSVVSLPYYTISPCLRKPIYSA